MRGRITLLGIVGCCLWLSLFFASAPVLAGKPEMVYVPELGGEIPVRARLGALVEDDVELGLIVSRVYPHTPAARMGLCVGDRILAIDGAPVGSWAEAVRILNRKASHDETTLVAQRAGAHLMLAVAAIPEYEMAAAIANRTPARKSSEAPPVTKLVLNVPVGSSVYLAGKPMHLTGARRQYDTTSLASGQWYEHYPIRVEVTRNGDTYVHEEWIELHAGETKELFINFDPTAQAAMSSAWKRR